MNPSGKIYGFSQFLKRELRHYQRITDQLLCCQTSKVMEKAINISSSSILNNLISFMRASDLDALLATSYLKSLKSSLIPSISSVNYSLKYVGIRSKSPDYGLFNELCLWILYTKFLAEHFVVDDFPSKKSHVKAGVSLTTVLSLFLVAFNHSDLQTNVQNSIYRFADYLISIF